MLDTAAMARALRKIETELAGLAVAADALHPVDPHEVKIAAIRVGCQAELLEKGLIEA